MQSAELQGDATVIRKKKSARKETRQQRQEKGGKWRTLCFEYDFSVNFLEQPPLCYLL